MKFPQTLPDIRDEMQKLNIEFVRLLDTIQFLKPDDVETQLTDALTALMNLTDRLDQLTNALTEAIIDQMRILLEARK